MSPSEFTLPAFLEGCILLSLGISQEHVSYETKMAGYFPGIYSPRHLNNNDFSWAHGHVAKDFISQFPLKLDVAM